MKKKVLEVITIIIFVIGIILLLTGINTLNKKCKSVQKANQKLYIEFSENNLIDTSNKINLSSIKKTRDDLMLEVKTVFDNKEISLEEAKVIIAETEKNNDFKANEINNLTDKSSELTDKLNNLTKQYEILNNKYQQQLAVKKAEEQKRIQESTIKISNFPTINQYPKYPTGCESVAITLLLNYYGVNVSADNIINNLKKGSLPYKENNVLYGGNPELEFVGNPYQNNSYGVYERPIANAALNYKSGINIKNNFPFSEVLSLVKNKKPVVVWTSMGLSLPYISSSWIYKPTEEKINWKAGEHAVVIIGYNDSQVIISDPIGGTIKYQSRSLFENRYNYFGEKALYY